MPSKRSKQQKKPKNQHPGPKVPPTPVSASDEHEKSMDKSSGRPDTTSGSASPYLTPPTSPSSPTIPLLSMDALTHELQKLDPELSADDAATPTQQLDHAAAEANGSQEEQVDLDQQAEDEGHAVEHTTELEQETQTEEKRANSDLKASFTSKNEENTEPDEQQRSEEEKHLLDGEQHGEDVHRDGEEVQIVPNQQPHDEMGQEEQQASVEMSENDQARMHTEDLLGEPVPNAQDNRQEDDIGQGESDDTNAESQSQESDTQNGNLPEGQQNVDSAPQSQELEVEQLVDVAEYQEEDDQQQTSELDNHMEREPNEGSERAEEAQDVNVDQEVAGDLIQFDFWNNDQQLEDDDSHPAEEHAVDAPELHEDENDQITGDNQALDQQLVEDPDQVPEDSQHFSAELEQVAEHGQQLKEQGPIKVDQQAGEEQEHAHEDEQQVEAEPGHIVEDNLQHENEQEPVESDRHLSDEAEHTPEADQQQEQEQEPQTTECDSEQQHQDEQGQVETDVQVETEPENALDGDQQTQEVQEEVVKSDQPNDGRPAEGGEHVEEARAPIDIRQQFDHEDSSKGNGQIEQEQDITGNDETLGAERAELAGDQQPDKPQEETDVADHRLEFDSPEIAIEPPEDGFGVHSDEEYVDDQQIETEQEHTEGEDGTLGDDQEDNELIQQEMDAGNHFDVPMQSKDDDPFLDEEQDTAYEPELEDIQEEMTDEEMEDPRAGAVLDISSKDVASRDLLALADLFANMKSTLATMSSAFDRLGSQTEKMASLGLDAKAAEQLQRIKSTLEAQIARHQAEVETVKNALRAKVKEALEARIRDHLHVVIKSSIQNIIEEKVRQELSVQIPEDLCQQVISHKRQILEVKASLHNSEARRYNALQTIPTMNARLRPLLRPLPTPEQSPVPISMSRSSSMGHSNIITPTTAFLQVPAPTPIRRSGSNSFRPMVPDAIPPSPSPFFPRDMTTLFALNPEETKRLLREYGLSSAVASPAVEHPVRPRGLSIVNEDVAEEEDQDIHARDLNTFMAHIGVPFLMIPAPKEKHNQSAPLSSRSRRKLLTPLIIK